MKKIYLIGKKYDDFVSGGFYVTSVASTIEQAKTIKEYLQENNENSKYEIREWDVDVINPIAEIKRNTYYGCYTDANGQTIETTYNIDETYPYKIID